MKPKLTLLLPAIAIVAVSITGLLLVGGKAIPIALNTQHSSSLNSPGSVSGTTSQTTSTTPTPSSGSVIGASTKAPGVSAQGQVQQNVTLSNETPGHNQTPQPLSSPTPQPTSSPTLLKTEQCVYRDPTSHFPQAIYTSYIYSDGSLKVSADKNYDDLLAVYNGQVSYTPCDTPPTPHGPTVTISN